VISVSNINLVDYIYYSFPSRSYCLPKFNSKRRLSFIRASFLNRKMNLKGFIVLNSQCYSLWLTKQIIKDILE
jgi:hypothetical protein